MDFLKTKCFKNRIIRETIIYVLVPIISIYIASTMVYIVNYSDNAPQIHLDGISYSVPLFAVNVDEVGRSKIRIQINTTDPYINHIECYKVSHGEVRNIRSGWMPLIANNRKASIKIPVDEEGQEQVCVALKSIKGYVYRFCAYDESTPMIQKICLPAQTDCYTSDNAYLFSIISDGSGCYTIEQKDCVNRIPLEPVM